VPIEAQFGVFVAFMSSVATSGHASLATRVMPRRPAMVLATVSTKDRGAVGSRKVSFVHGSSTSGTTNLSTGTTNVSTFGTTNRSSSCSRAVWWSMLRSGGLTPPEHGQGQDAQGSAGRVQAVPAARYPAGACRRSPVRSPLCSRAPALRVSCLANGVRVTSAEMPGIGHGLDRRSLSASLLANTGSIATRDPPASDAGFSHHKRFVPAALPRQLWADFPRGTLSRAVDGLPVRAALPHVVGPRNVCGPLSADLPAGDTPGKACEGREGPLGDLHEAAHSQKALIMSHKSAVATFTAFATARPSMNTHTGTTKGRIVRYTIAPHWCPYRSGLYGHNRLPLPPLRSLRSLRVALDLGCKF
jgi:hypothetical protein